MAKQLKNLKQYNVRIRPALIEQLDELAVRYGAESGNKVAGEIIEQYLPFWVAAETVRQETLEQQRAHVAKHTPDDVTILRFEKPVKKPKLRAKRTKLSG
jgi:predicted DNA-binding protein